VRTAARNNTRSAFTNASAISCAAIYSHRNRPSEGLDGGGNGEIGKTEVRRKDGRTEPLRACDQTVLEAVIVTTPTPGGFGRG
jgi:5-oxoprolinase (ATP-hydrolysing)